MDNDAELAELQRRAYGPQPDIDDAGRARLAELQERARRRRGGLLPADAPERADGEPARSDATSGADGPAGDDPLPDTSSAEREDPTVAAAPASASARRGWWRRPAVLMAAGVAAGAVVAAGISATVSATSGPDAVLRIVEEVGPEGGGPFNPFTPEMDVVRHDSYHGIEVTSSRGPEGACLVAQYVTRDAGVMGDLDCAPASMSPQVGLWIGHSRVMPTWFMGARLDGIEAGTYLLFRLDGDVVNVWRDDPPQPTPDDTP